MIGMTRKPLANPRKPLKKPLENRFVLVLHALQSLQFKVLSAKNEISLQKTTHGLPNEPLKKTVRKNKNKTAPCINCIIGKNQANCWLFSMFLFVHDRKTKRKTCFGVQAIVPLGSSSNSKTGGASLAKELKAVDGEFLPN